MKGRVTLDRFLTKHGHKVSLDSDEKGLTLGDALIAANLAADSSRAILGGDVYVERDGDVVLAYANWHIDRMPNETDVLFRSRSVRESVEYIRRYPYPQSGKPLFVLIIEPPNDGESAA